MGHVSDDIDDEHRSAERNSTCAPARVIPDKSTHYDEQSAARSVWKTVPREVRHRRWPNTSNTEEHPMTKAARRHEQ